MSDALLSVQSLGIELGGRFPVKNVSFEVSEGHCLALVGETGCGKSMTCRAVIGLLDRIGARACRGRIVFQGTDLLPLSSQQWRKLRGRGISFIPQSSLSSLNPVRRVGKQLEETVGILDPSADAKARSVELLNQVHIDRPLHVLRLYPHELSGGMRQRVMIALALAGRPKLLVADEPTTALDVTVQREILLLLTELRAATGMAVILVTHDLGIVKSVADTVAVMYAGIIVEMGQARQVIGDARHPYARALLEARPLESRAGRLVAIVGSPPGLDESLPGCPFAPRCRFVDEGCEKGVPPLVEYGPEGSVACWRSADIVHSETLVQP